MNFNHWIKYFTSNQNHFSDLSWDCFNPLTPHELELLTPSLQQFQRGEHSEGHNLIRFSGELRDTDYTHAIKLFVREEQKHAMVLAKFMEKEGIPPIRTHWVDSLFRKVRRLAGLELSVIVLTTAELIAAVFYKSLYFASNSVVLKEICEQILRDEEMHINFQAFTLKTICIEKCAAYRFISRTFHELVTRAAILLVYIDHRRVLRAGNYNFIRFHDEVMEEFYRLEKMITGKTAIAIKPAKVNVVMN